MAADAEVIAKVKGTVLEGTDPLMHVVRPLLQEPVLPGAGGFSCQVQPAGRVLQLVGWA